MTHMNIVQELETILQTPLPVPSPFWPLSEEGVVLYGAGSMGQMALDCMERSGMRPRYYVDANCSTDDIRGVAVIKPTEVPEADKHSLSFVVCIASIPYEPIAEDLRNLGCTDVRHFYDFSELSFPHLMPNGWLLNNPDRDSLLAICHGLAHDKGSLAHFFQFLWWRIARREVVYEDYPVLSGRKYFKAPCISPAKENEVLFDCGVHSGGTIESFLEYVNDHPFSVHGFEPDPTMYATACRFNSSNILIENKAVAATQGKAAFTSGLDYASSLSDDGDVVVKTVMLDDYLEEGPTVIKIHVEGAELAVLEGARQCIEVNRPTIMVFADHSIDGLYGIPQYLQSLKGYEFYFYLHDYCGNSGVFYAIPQ